MADITIDDRLKDILRHARDDTKPEELEEFAFHFRDCRDELERLADVLKHPAASRTRRFGRRLTARCCTPSVISFRRPGCITGSLIRSARRRPSPRREAVFYHRLHVEDRSSQECFNGQKPSGESR